MNINEEKFIDFVEFSHDLGDRLPKKYEEKYRKLIRYRKRAKNLFRLKMFLKKRLGVILAVLIVSGVFTLFYILNSLSEDLRGYAAVGGEFLILFLPIALIFGRDLLHDLLDLFK